MSGDVGIYAQVKVSKKDASIINNILWCILDGITVTTPEKFLKPEDYHTTLLYSRVGNSKDIPVSKSHYPATIKDLEFWDDSDKVLVCTLDCPSLEKRHVDLMSTYDLQWDYPSFKPHITLCYDLSFGVNLLSRLKDKLVGKDIVLLDEEITDLDTDHSDTEE